MQVAMSGSTGFIGRSIQKTFEEKGWSVIGLTRNDFQAESSGLAQKLEGCDAVINLAGAPIAARWTEAYKKILYQSRIHTTRMIVSSCATLDQKPKVLLSASGAGIYSTQNTHTEDDQGYAADFLAKLAGDWEQEALRAEQAGVRTAVFRFGVVLGKNGGALQRMLLPFKLGLGGKIGSGRQAFSWIHIQDLIRALIFAMEHTETRGIYNLTSPSPTTNEGFTRALAKALRRPAFLPVPGFFLKILFGEGASILLEGQRVIPKRLMEGGFEFTFKTIEEALTDLI